MTKNGCLCCWSSHKCGERVSVCECVRVHSSLRPDGSGILHPLYTHHPDCGFSLDFWAFHCFIVVETQGSKFSLLTHAHSQLVTFFISPKLLFYHSRGLHTWRQYLSVRILTASLISLDSNMWLSLDIVLWVRTLSFMPQGPMQPFPHLLYKTFWEGKMILIFAPLCITNFFPSSSSYFYLSLVFCSLVMFSDVVLFLFRLFVYFEFLGPRSSSFDHFGKFHVIIPSECILPSFWDSISIHAYCLYYPDIPPIVTEAWFIFLKPFFYVWLWVDSVSTFSSNFK